MFSLFSALGLNKASDSPLRRIPYYASLLFFELLHDSNLDKCVVQFSFKNGLEVSMEATIFRHDYSKHSPSFTVEKQIFIFLSLSYFFSQGKGEGGALQCFVLEGSTQGLTPYLFVYHFNRKGTHFLYLS